MVQEAKRFYTEDEYFALEEDTGEKYEYFDGEIFLMAGGTINHNAISANIVSALKAVLKGRGCRVFTSDQRFKVGAANAYTHPDVAVVCAQPIVTKRQKDTITNPILIVEVLSESTKKEDRGVKADLYRAIPSVMDYLLVHQDKVLVEYWQRLEVDTWLVRILRGRDAAIDLHGVEATISLADIYDEIDFALLDSVLVEEDTDG